MGLSDTTDIFMVSIFVIYTKLLVKITCNKQYLLIIGTVNNFENSFKI